MCWTGAAEQHREMMRITAAAAIENPDPQHLAGDLDRGVASQELRG